MEQRITELENRLAALEKRVDKQESRGRRKASANPPPDVSQTPHYLYLKKIFTEVSSTEQLETAAGYSNSYDLFDTTHRCDKFYDSFWRRYRNDPSVVSAKEFFKFVKLCVPSVRLDMPKETFVEAGRKVKRNVIYLPSLTATQEQFAAHFNLTVAEEAKDWYGKEERKILVDFAKDEEERVQKQKLEKAKSESRKQLLEEAFKRRGLTLRIMDAERYVVLKQWHGITPTDTPGKCRKFIDDGESLDFDGSVEDEAESIAQAEESIVKANVLAKAKAEAKRQERKAKRLELAELRKRILQAALTMHGLSPETVNSSRRCGNFVDGNTVDSEDSDIPEQDLEIDEAAITEEAQRVAELEAQEVKATKSRRKLLEEAFKKVGLFDEERMEGFILDQMTKGVDQSHVIVAFLTQSYMQKVGSNRHNDNCKLEFNYAVNHCSLSFVPYSPSNT